MPKYTRERIVSAAYQALVELGYEAASVKDIAVRAGVAAGLVHYYFASKEDLVLAAIRFGCDEFEKDAGQGLEQGPEQEALRAFAGAKQTMTEERRLSFYRLFIDMCGVAMHNPAVAQALRLFVDEDRARIEALARSVLAQRGRTSTEASAIAGTVWGAIYGITLQSLLDPNFKHEEAMDTLARMAMEGA